MRLRYLRLRDYPPIRDTATCFASNSPLQRECAIRFVVGLNGSGKSHLLRALTEIFVALSEPRLPHFPVSLVYELGERNTSKHRTLVLDFPGQRDGASLWLAEQYNWPDAMTVEEFNQVFNQLRSNKSLTSFSPLIASGTWPVRATTPVQIALPRAVLAYTTGELKPWQALWQRTRNLEGLDLDWQSEEYDTAIERPPDWSITQEQFYQQQENATDPKEQAPGQQDEIEQNTSTGGFRQPLLLTAPLLKCALLCVALPEALRPPDLGETARLAFQQLLRRGNWKAPVSVAFRMQFRPDRWSRTLKVTARRWLLCAGEAIAEPSPSAARTLHFDLRGEFRWQSLEGVENDPQLSLCQTQGEALWALLGTNSDTPFERFSRLVELHRAGLFEDVTISLHKTDSLDVLSFNELSDGEQMVLGRMALFYLLQGQDDSLLLLDEPETHFNDRWKRDIVNIVDEALGNTASEVIISTHAALVLTDALRDEITLLVRNGDNGAQIVPLGDEIHTFGATSDHPLRDVFGAPDTVGTRASKLIEVLLAASMHADAVEAYWLGEQSATDAETISQVLATAKESEEGLTEEIVANSLGLARRFALHFGVKPPVKVKDVIDAFIPKMGPGYFQIELMRAWRRLNEGTSHATQTPTV